MTRSELTALLDSRGIKYELCEHDPVYTIEEMLKAALPYPDTVAKNLFVRDDKKRNYYLITVKEDRRVDLREFQAQFQTRKLSFASENDLMDILKLIKGAVTPFGLLNDEERRVHFFIDRAFLPGTIGIHPLENTATVWLRCADLLELIREHGNSVTEL